MEVVSMHNYKNQGHYGNFPHGQRALCRENHNKNALIEIIQRTRTNNLHHFCVSLHLIIQTWQNYSCNLQLFFASSWSLRAASCVCVMFLSVNWLFNILRTHCTERPAASLCLSECKIKMSALLFSHKDLKFFALIFHLNKCYRFYPESSLLLCMTKCNQICMLLSVTLVQKEQVLFMTKSLTLWKFHVIKLTWIFNTMMFLRKIKHNKLWRISWKMNIKH